MVDVSPLKPEIFWLNNWHHCQVFEYFGKKQPAFKNKNYKLQKWKLQTIKTLLQSGRSSLAKHGGAYFSAVYGFMKDLIAAPGPYENQEC